MNAILDLERQQERARGLTTAGGNAPAFNGIARLFVTLDAASPPAFAWVDVEFYNDTIALTELLNDAAVGPAAAIFPIIGGSRLSAGNQPGQVQVTEVQPGSATNFLRLKVHPVGDYSTYTLRVDASAYAIDPLFAQAAFKFRPGCFNTHCAPLGRRDVAPKEPLIDYLARDFQSFKHLLINAFRERVPGWQPTSEADLDQVLIDLLAADGDELADYQDRVFNEAYFGRARKRVSLARHARLMDYHIHQGNQASTWLALIVSADHTVVARDGAKCFAVWSGQEWQDPSAEVFIGEQDQACFTALNRMSLYTWGGVVTALDAGATAADVIATAGVMTQAEADALAGLLRREDVTHLLIEQKLNPQTGTLNGLDQTARQIVRLLDGNAAAESGEDPVGGTWFVRVRWRAEDRLRRRYCFVSRREGQPPVPDVSAFHANLIRISHGRPHITVFRPPGEPFDPADPHALLHHDEAHHEPGNWGTLCRLPHKPLAYRATEPGGQTPPLSTLSVRVNGFASAWRERSDLIESESDDLDFVVETDEMDGSLIRFGSRFNGRTLPSDAVVTCFYQVGRGSRGNVGAGTLTGFDGSPTGFPQVQAVWNPLDVTGGRDPETREEIVRRAPLAYRARQLRAVTLEDYARRAEELPDVAHALAQYAWTGSWRTVCVAIDPRGTDRLEEPLRRRIARHLDAVRLIGEDLEVRGAVYAPLDVLLTVCAAAEHWPEALEFELAEEFSDGYTAGGHRGFFHPDDWTFGQPLHASQIIGRALVVPGVERVLRLSIRRWHAGRGAGSAVIAIDPNDLPLHETRILEVAAHEIIQVAGDPDHLERGRIQFDILGGRR